MAMNCVMQRCETHCVWILYMKYLYIYMLNPQCEQISGNLLCARPNSYLRISVFAATSWTVQYIVDFPVYAEC